MDYTFVLKCLKARALPLCEPDQLPRMGWVAFWGDSRLGALFLRECEGNFVIFDSLVTDPNQPGVLRDLANDALIARAVDECYWLDLTRIIAFSLDKNTLERVKKHGFIHQPHTLVSLDLS